MSYYIYASGRKPQAHNNTSDDNDIITTPIDRQFVTVFPPPSQAQYNIYMICIILYTNLCARKTWYIYIYMYVAGIIYRHRTMAAFTYITCT